MSNVLEQLLSLAAAGSMMISNSLLAAAPQNDVDGLLFLQNRQWRVSRYFEPATLKANVPGQLQDMRADAAAALEEMFAACKAEIGVTLKAVSGYRSYQRQATIYQNKLDRVKTKEKADQYVARPGASEHQLALAMDVGQKSDDVNLTSSFGRTKGGKWVAENCWRFGFILRYQEGWEDVTGYEYEPWHVRYVGLENARLIHEADMPLETYLLMLREDTRFSAYVVLLNYKQHSAFLCKGNYTFFTFCGGKDRRIRLSFLLGVQPRVLLRLREQSPRVPLPQVLLQRREPLPLPRQPPLHGVPYFRHGGDGAPPSHGQCALPLP